MLGDIDVALCESVAAELGSDTLALPLDVTDRASFTAFFDAAEAAAGPIDILINNAGIAAVGPFADEPYEVSERTVAINLNGVLIGSKLAVERFVPRRHGHVFNVSSMAGRLSTPNCATYCGTKAAVASFTDGLRLELRGTGVQVTKVLPSWARTELMSGIKVPAVLERLTMVDPEDVARAIVNAAAQRHAPSTVVVPPFVDAIYRLTAPFQGPLVEGVLRAIRADQILMGVDKGARRDYVHRTT